MRLEAVRFKHFRCLYDSDWIQTGALTILIGENDCGKTAALDGVAILVGEARGKDEDISFKIEDENQEATEERAREDSFEIVGRFIPEAGDDLEGRGIPLDDEGKAVLGVCYFEGRHEWSATGNVPADPELRVDPTALKTSDMRRLLKAKGERPAGTRREPIEAMFREAIERSPKVLDRKVFGGPPHIGLFKVVDFRTADELHTVLNSTLRTLFGELIRSNKYKALAAVERKLARDLQAKANEIQEFVKRHRSDVGEVIVRPRVDFAQGYRNTEIDIEDRRGNPIPLRMRGEGMKAHLRLAGFEWTGQILRQQSEGTRVFLLDEPDTHLDYHAQRKLAVVIDEYSKKGQVLVATHSMHLINSVGLERIVSLEVDRSTGRSLAKKVAPSTGEEADEINRIGALVGIENAVLLYERVFFLFEGATELHALPKMYELWTGSRWYLDGVRFQNGWNNTGAILLARLLHTNGRAVVVLVDEDTEQLKGFKRQFTRQRLESQALLPAERIRTIRPVFFEMAFSNSVWSRVIYRATEGKRKVRRATLDARRSDPREFIRFLEEVTSLSKPELGRLLSEHIRKSEIPDELGAAFDMARELAKR